MSTRPVRRAATKAAVTVVLSDSEIDTPVKPKRGRGRPKAKVDPDDADFEIKTSPKKAVKRRGRPAKKVSDADAEDDEAEVDEKPPKKRVKKEEVLDEDGNPVKVVKPRAKRAAAPKKPAAPRKPRATKATSSKAKKVEAENQDPNSDEALNDLPDGPILSVAKKYAGRPSMSNALNSSFMARRKVWDIYELLAETENIDTLSAKNIVYLFENDNTIPFICRYRRDLISHNITPEKLRDIKNTYTEILALRKKAETIVSQLEKEIDISDEVRAEMMCAKSAEELEFLYAPYKPASKGSLADRAKALGLEEHADRLLFGDMPPVNLNAVINRKNPDLDTFDKVCEGVCNIISHNFAKHTGILEELRRLQKVHNITLKCTKAKVVEPKESKDDSTSKSAAFTSSHGNRNDQSKYESYFKFENAIRYIKPHQVLAINRGEKSKFLSVKINIPDYFKNDIKRFIGEIFCCEQNYPLRTEILEKAFEECYTKKLVPLVSRQIRSDLSELAKKASIDVFAKNLKQLLLMSPLKGERILGVDPGFTNGCKLALISETADVLETGVVYPHNKRSDPDQCGITLAKMLIRNRCKIIALGNGTACRETEFWLTKLYEKGILDPDYVRYSIVSEQGASIYSCSEVAKKEFPDLDMNVISAVSIARRLNDPLSEYVKIEPRHIGVGMYQHDINEKTLSESLNEVVSECVSYVGVDINTASLSVLKHIAGLTEKRAEKIIQHRQENGPFRTRKDLLQVKTVGEKTFVQCAGFIRIEPKSLGGEVDNLLDCTWVHPESYTVAKKIISKCGLNLKNIGESDFIFKIKSFSHSQSIESLAGDFGIPSERLQVVLEALQRQLFQDYRSDFDKKPLFKQGITRMEDLFVGEIVTGAVTNITHFGAFVDIGIECDGLIHVSKMNGMVLNLGDRVNTSVIDIDKARRRIALRLDELI